MTEMTQEKALAHLTQEAKFPPSVEHYGHHGGALSDLARRIPLVAQDPPTLQPWRGMDRCPLLDTRHDG